MNDENNKQSAGMFAMNKSIGSFNGLAGAGLFKGDFGKLMNSSCAAKVIGTPPPGASDECYDQYPSLPKVQPAQPKLQIGEVQQIFNSLIEQEAGLASMVRNNEAQMLVFKLQLDQALITINELNFQLQNVRQQLESVKQGVDEEVNREPC